MRERTGAYPAAVLADGGFASHDGIGAATRLQLRARASLVELANEQLTVAWGWEPCWSASPEQHGYRCEVAP